MFAGIWLYVYFWLQQMSLAGLTQHLILVCKIIFYYQHLFHMHGAV